LQITGHRNVRVGIFRMLLGCGSTFVLTLEQQIPKLLQFRIALLGGRIRGLGESFG
jgi:hypothetical protein